MASDILSREQRLRKEAELQSLYSALAGFRHREATYIEASATIPRLFLHQINDIRQKISDVEHELADLEDETAELPTPPFYQQAFEAELNEDYATAIKLYKSASRHGHQDAQAALRSLRYTAKAAKRENSAGNWWTPAGSGQSSNRIWIALAVLIIFGLVVAFTLRGRSQPNPQLAAAVAPTASNTPTVKPTQTLLSTPTASQTSSPVPTTTDTPLPPPPTPTQGPAADTGVPAAATAAPIVIAATGDTSTLAPPTVVTVVSTLRPAPKIREPKDGLVWNDGAVVFEFEWLNLASDELYCVDTLRGYDIANSENWSFPPFGDKRPYAVIEPNVFRVARAQNVRCIIWSAYLGRETCEMVISESTAQRVIGLPQPCDLNLIEAYSQSNQNP